MPGRRREEAVSHSRGRVKEASPAGAGSRQTTATAEPSLVAHQTGRGRNLAGIAPTKRAATVTSARKEETLMKLLDDTCGKLHVASQSL